MSGETNITNRDAGSVAQGLAAMWVAVVSFSVADAIGKWGGGEGFAAVQIVFFRYLFGLIPLALVLWWSGLEAVRTKRPWAHALRGLLLSAALALFFWGLKYVPLADGIAVAFTAPLFITALSVPVLGERVGPARWAAVLVGFAGMLVIVQPGTDTFRPEMGIIVASALVFALGITYTRRLSRTETVAGMFTWTTVVSLVVFGPLALLTWKTPDVQHLGAFAALGLIGGAAHYLVGIAYRNAPAAVVAPQEYAALVWGALIGWFMWGDVPSAATWAGAAIVAAAGGFIAVREQRAERRRKAAVAEAAA
ncbi:MAG: DMT family transporter [Anderseniella sp.]|nr:DMT family transporter [Anderseniella sp.]